MRVNFYGTLRDLTGDETVELDAHLGLTARQIIELLAVRYPQLRDVFLDAHNRLYDYIPMFVNGRNPRLLPGGLDTHLENKDVVSLFSTISVGRMNVEALQGSGSLGEKQEG
jgi:MoaD family protein